MYMQEIRPWYGYLSLQEGLIKVPDCSGFFLAIPYCGPVRLLFISMYWKILRDIVVGFFISSIFDLVLNAAGVI